LGATLHVLGAGSILPRAGYGCAGYALRTGTGEPVTLLDCGPGSVRALGAHGIELGDVRRVVFSHYHLDHCLDLFALAFARRNPRFAPAPLELVGPVGLARLVDETARALGRWAVDPDATVREVALDGEGRGSVERGALRLRCRKNGHNAESVSWRLDHARWSLAYTGDTDEDPRVAELAEGVGLLVAECSFADDDAAPNHLTPRSAGRLARDARAGRLLLTHFYPGLEPEDARAAAARVFEGPIELARDGSMHPLEP
jgi:ribonuclease Z